MAALFHGLSSTTNENLLPTAASFRKRMAKRERRRCRCPASKRRSNWRRMVGPPPGETGSSALDALVLLPTPLPEREEVQPSLPVSLDHCVRGVWVAELCLETSDTRIQVLSHTSIGRLPTRFCPSA